MKVTRVLLAGGGPTHIEVLRRYAHARDEALEITLAAPQAQALYAGMLPGVVAGHYAAADAEIDLAALARWAGSHFIPDSVAALDLYTRIATLASGEFVPFDILSLDIDALPDRAIAGAAEHAISIRPARDFHAAWERVEGEIRHGEIHTLAVVGAGAGAIELLLAMHHKLAATQKESLPRFALVVDRPELLPGHSREARRRVGQALVAREVVIHRSSAIAAIEPRGLVTADRRRIATDRVVLVTLASGPEWLAASGLACDAHGFVRTNDHLQSVSHAFVFATPGCAALDAAADASARSAGAHAARTLAANLSSHARGEGLSRYRPRAGALALIATGARRAIVSRPPFVAEGEWVWNVKDRVDRRFVARFRPPVAMPAAPVEEERLS